MSWCQSHCKLRKISNYAREIETYSWNACQTVSHSHTTKNMNAAVSEWHKRAHQFCEIDFIQKVLMDVVDSNTDTENDSDLRYSEVPLKGKDKTLVKILGVVNTGRPLQVKYWGVTTPATPAALTPIWYHITHCVTVDFHQHSASTPSQWSQLLSLLALK